MNNYSELAETKQNETAAFHSKTIQRVMLTFLLLFLPFVVLILGSLKWFVDEALEQQTASVITASYNQIDYAAHASTWKLEAALDASEILLNQLTSAGFDGSSSAQVLTRIEHSWKDVMLARKLFMQFRLIDLQGQELVRVEYSAPNDTVIVVDKLQFKGRRAYMQQAFKLDDQEILVTAPEANIEWGEISQPITGVVRFIRPILAAGEKRIGYLVINVNFEALMESVDQLPSLVDVQPSVIGEHGFYLSSADPDWLYGHQITERQQHQFSALYPELWEHMQAQSSGDVLHDGSIFVFSLAPVSQPDSKLKLWPYKNIYWVTKIPLALVEQSIVYKKQRALVVGTFAIFLLAILLFPSSYLIAMHANRNREGRLAKAAMNSLSASVVTDAEGTIVDVNKRFTVITGYSAEEAIGSNPRVLNSGTHDAAFFRSFWASLKEQGSWAGEIWNRRKSGEIYPQLVEVQAIKNARGKATHFAASFVDISKQKQVEQKLLKASTHDPLTGCLNRRGFNEHLSVQFELNRRHGGSYCLAIMDVDHFKRINDTFGHDAGDQVLVDFVKSIESMLRKSDRLARVGGEEFVIVMPMTTAEGAVQLLKRIREHIASQTREIPFTFSAGITVGRPEDSRDSALSRADKALYCAKDGGRNQIRLHVDSGEHQFVD